MGVLKSSSKSQSSSNDSESDTRISNTPPSKSELDAVANLPVLDAARKSYKFKTLYQSKAKVLIVFIRHFFCGVRSLSWSFIPGPFHPYLNTELTQYSQNCQEYLRTLSSVLSPESLKNLPTPTEIIVIGCGQPDLIPMYIRETECPFPIYADPSKKLYQRLGMMRTLDLGPKNPAYMQMSVPSAIVRSFLMALRAGSKALSGGDFSQVGGEFLFENDCAVWCHRMKNTRDHAEFAVLKTELGYDGARPPVRKRWSTGLVRSLSNRRQSWSRSRERGDRDEKPRPMSVVMDRVKEEPTGTPTQVDVAA